MILVKRNILVCSEKVLIALPVFRIILTILFSDTFTNIIALIIIVYI